METSIFHNPISPSKFSQINENSLLEVFKSLESKK